MASTKKNAPSAEQDPYFKKLLPFEHAGARLQLRVSQDLFSSFDVDVGTRFLLRNMNVADIAGMKTAGTSFPSPTGPKPCRWRAARAGSWGRAARWATLRIVTISTAASPQGPVGRLRCWRWQSICDTTM